MVETEQKYRLTGMTCTSCESKVKSSLSELKELSEISVSVQDQSVTIVADQVIPLGVLQDKLDTKYKISNLDTAAPSDDTISNHDSSDIGFNWSDTQVWKKAGFNTLNCLIGCSIGDFGMVIFLQYFYPDTPMAWQMILAIIAGLMTSVALETLILNKREKLGWQLAFKTAIGMSFLSMVGMEIAMNTTDFMITGGKMALSDPKYWLAFIPSAVMGFLAPLPYNYYQLKKHNKACH